METYIGLKRSRLIKVNFALTFERLKTNMLGCHWKIFIDNNIWNNIDSIMVTKHVVVIGYN